MAMTKREIAIASVMDYTGSGQGVDDQLKAFATGVVDQLITDGVIAIGYAGNPDVSEIVEQFSIAAGNTVTSKTDRFAASRLAKRYSVPVVVHVIQQYGARRREKYAPTANSLTEFERKWPSIERFINNGGEGTDD